MVFVAKSKGVDAVYADPKEGYLLWAMAAYLTKNPNRSAEQTKAAYQLLDFMLGGWYGAKITVLRGYMTNTDAPDYAKEHPDEFPAAEAQKVADITANVRRKFAQGRHLAESLADAGRRLRIRVGALQGGLSGQGQAVAARSLVLRAFLFLPIVFLAVFLLVPLGLMIAVSFWERAGLLVRPAFVLTSYFAFFEGVRLLVLERSLLVSLRGDGAQPAHRLPDRLLPCLQGTAGGDAHRPPPLHRALPGQLHHPDLRLDLSPRPHRSDQCACSWRAA